MTFGTLGRHSAPALGATLLAACLLGGTFAPPAALAQCGNSECGDLDDSGSTSAPDALLLLKCAVGQSVNLECQESAGLACWDTDEDGICDAEEDIDGDEGCSATDCQGPPGPQGEKGDTGSQGPPGEKGEQGDPGPATLVGLLNIVDQSGVIDSDEEECIVAACESGQVVTGCGFTNSFPELIQLTGVRPDQVEKSTFGCVLCGYVSEGGGPFSQRGIFENVSVQAVCAD